MNVLFLTHNYPRHDKDYSGVFLHLLARQLKNESVEVTVLAPHDAGLPESEILEGIPVRRFRYDSDEKEIFAYRGNMHKQLISPAGLLRFRRFLREFEQSALELVKEKQFDLIACHWAIPAAPVGYRVSHKHDLPLVVHSHGTDVRLLAKLPFARWFAKDALQRAKSWSVVSSYLQNVAQGAFRNHADKIEVCPLPNDESLFKSDESTTRFPVRIVSVTRFTEQKRITNLLKACEILKDRGVEFDLVIIGAGPLEAQVKELVESSNLSGHVSIFPPIPHAQLSAQYSRAQVVVLNSFKEGFGLTLVEGALCGALPVGVNSGGITDIIEPGKNGLLAEVDNVESLANTLQAALENPEKTREMAAAAQKNAKERFTGPAVARRYAEMYHRAISAE